MSQLLYTRPEGKYPISSAHASTLGLSFSEGLADIVNEFNEGKNLTFTNEELRWSTRRERIDYFKNKGKHFVAGYLTSVGVQCEAYKKFYNDVEQRVLRWRERPAYRAAIVAWNHMHPEDPRWGLPHHDGITSFK